MYAACLTWHSKSRSSQAPFRALRGAHLRDHLLTLLGCLPGLIEVRPLALAVPVLQPPEMHAHVSDIKGKGVNAEN